MRAGLTLLRPGVFGLLGVLLTSMLFGAAAVLRADREEPQPPETSFPPVIPGATIIHNPGPGEAAPGFVSGTLVSWEDGVGVVRAEAGGDLVRLRPAPGVKISGGIRWEDIHVGDRITATGEPSSDGTISVRIVSVNVIQIRGTLLEVTPEGNWIVFVRNGSSSSLSGGAVQIGFDANRPPLDGKNNLLSLGNLSRARIGAPVIVIGVAAPGDAVVRATRVDYWEAKTSQPSARNEGVE